MNYPRISVVTVSFNQVNYLEQTILSVLKQDYPNMEYILIDGGSTDGSVEIIKRHAGALNYWVSEEDQGQSQALNKGFAKSSGAILCWLNSDDLLEPGALDFVARTVKDPHKPSWLIGATRLIDGNNDQITIRLPRSVTVETFNRWSRDWFPQQSTFWTRSLWEKTGDLREDLHYLMDMELWLRMWEQAKPQIVDTVLSSYRFHQDAKCFQDNSRLNQEWHSIMKEYHLKRSKPVGDVGNWLKEMEKALSSTGGWRRHFMFSNRGYLDSNAVIARWRIKMRLKKWIGTIGANAIEKVYHLVRDLALNRQKLQL